MCHQIIAQLYVLCTAIEEQVGFPCRWDILLGISNPSCTPAQLYIISEHRGLYRHLCIHSEINATVVDGTFVLNGYLVAHITFDKRKSKYTRGCKINHIT
jgi:hypothetical protein